MNNLDLKITLSPEAKRQLETSYAQQRIMDCITKKLPITEHVFDGLLTLTDINKKKLLSNAEQIISMMNIPLSASLTREIEKVSKIVSSTLEQLNKDRQLSAEDINVPLDAAWLNNLPALKRESILSERSTPI